MDAPVRKIMILCPMEANERRAESLPQMGREIAIAGTGNARRVATHRWLVSALTCGIRTSQ